MIRRLALFFTVALAAVIGGGAPTALMAQGNMTPEEIAEARQHIDLIFRRIAGSDLRNLESLRLGCAAGLANRNINEDRGPSEPRISYTVSAGVCLTGMTTPQDQLSIDYFSELIPMEVRRALRGTMSEERVDQTVFTIIQGMATTSPDGEDWYMEVANSATGQTARHYFPMSAGLFTGFIEIGQNAATPTQQARQYAGNIAALRENIIRCFADIDEHTPTYDAPGTPEGEVPDRRVCHWSGQAIALLGGNLQIVGEH